MQILLPCGGAGHGRPELLLLSWAAPRRLFKQGGGDGVGSETTLFLLVPSHFSPAGMMICGITNLPRIPFLQFTYIVIIIRKLFKEHIDIQKGKQRVQAGNY